ncbi:hypothetical protein [Amaricoccus sp. W119]|uniref:hypothetical protein n=1 Tax=Amaricoccus sp. W119 TaxID=3391833 RepID=UPI0039A60776
MNLPAPLRRGIGARPVLTRWLLAGPGAVLLGLVTMCAMTLWLPAGPGGVDNIAIPIVLMPLLWAVPFFYATLEPDLERATAVMLGATLAQGLVLALVLV